jgi:hypothetical protein
MFTSVEAQKKRDIALEEKRADVHVPIASASLSHEPHITESPVISNEPLGRSQWEKRPAINSDEYVVYMNEEVNDIGKVDDPASFEEAMTRGHSSKWLEAVNDEIKSMSTNDVWDLVEIPHGVFFFHGVKKVACKWAYKTKHNSQKNVERFKTRLVAKAPFGTGGFGGFGVVY